VVGGGGCPVQANRPAPQLPGRARRSPRRGWHCNPSTTSRAAWGVALLSARRDHHRRSTTLLHVLRNSCPDRERLVRDRCRCCLLSERLAGHHAPPLRLLFRRDSIPAHRPAADGRYQGVCSPRRPLGWRACVLPFRAPPSTMRAAPTASLTPSDILRSHRAAAAVRWGRRSVFASASARSEQLGAVVDSGRAEILDPWDRHRDPSNGGANRVVHPLAPTSPHPPERHCWPTPRTSG